MNKKSFSHVCLFVLFSVAGFLAKAQALPENFSQVTSVIYRGARPANESEVQALRRQGIKTVIDLQGGDLHSKSLGAFVPYFEKGETPAEISREQTWVQMQGMNFFNAPLSALELPNDEEASLIKQVLLAMNDPSLQPVYVHCAFGADRTGLIIALYRVIYQKWPPMQAYKEMYAKGHRGIHLAATAIDQTFWLIVGLRDLVHH